MNRISLLLVDDNVEFCGLLSAALHSEGYEVVAATTVPSARDLLRKQRFDVLLCDMRIGNEVGLDLLRDQWPILVKQGTVSIVVSGETRYCVLCRELGVQHFIAKPFLVDDLLALVQRAISRRS